MLALDWSFDRFVEDAKMYKATPIKGVHCRAAASDRERFMTWFKNMARDFMQDWSMEHEHMYDRRAGYAGDAFERRLYRSGFSDYYKDTYGQRPHLAWWFYVQATGLPHSEDVIRTFCANPIEDAVKNAKFNRERF